jgi:hypothetical protein
MQRKAIAAIVNVIRVIAPVHISLSLPCGEQKRQNLGHMKTTTLPSKHSINRSSGRLALLLIPLAGFWFAFAPQARAVCQQGCLTNANTVLGDDALILNTTGFQNTAFGSQALLSNTTGLDNTAIGARALESNTTGSDNTAIGFNALLNNTNGNKNIALGSNAGFNLANDSNNIAIGNRGDAGQSNTIRIGNGTHNATFIAGISGAPAAGGVAVMIGSNGKLGTIASSERFKDKIQPMDKASEAILALKPVTFHYKHELDPDGIPQFGLVAEDVEKVNPDLVARDAAGKVYTVRYEAINAMLLNEFLKEHRKVEQLEKQVEALTAGLQKVSAQLEVGKSAPQTVLNNH